MDNALTFLVNQAKDNEDKAVMALNQARSELDNYYQQLEQIEQYRLDYCQQLTDRGQAGLTASQYGHLQRFLNQLDETLSKQREAETHFTQQVTNSEQHWLEVRKQRRSYEWLIEKKKTEKQQAEERREQQLMDEFSTLSFNRRRLNNHS
ncbi:flagellar export protein FliJ [Vibrio palustris]|uniref:Flagellar FliJ protein n=1 Tax=Vibrio palustris TaxID=1918946 RepID=A0A1R4B0A8_9VIBR|nr:flagellar export protein FliJ [Vibrio palustris]SJL82344.1 flagellar biosynthesis chaperone [Vibrio palustris]